MTAPRGYPSTSADPGVVDRLRAAVDSAMKRYENPKEQHNTKGGFPRPELAWAMYTDMQHHLLEGDRESSGFVAPADRGERTVPGEEPSED